MKLPAAATRLFLFGVLLLLTCAGRSAAAEAQVLYTLHCAGCHRPHGHGAASAAVPGLHDDLGRLLQVRGGRDYLVRVPGAAQAPVSDAELAAILNWVLYTFNFDTLPEGFEPFTPAEVGRARQQILADPLRYRAALWQAVTGR